MLQIMDIKEHLVSAELEINCEILDVLRNKIEISQDTFFDDNSLLQSMFEKVKAYIENTYRLYEQSSNNNGSENLVKAKNIVQNRNIKVSMKNIAVNDFYVNSFNDKLSSVALGSMQIYGLSAGIIAGYMHGIIISMCNISAAEMNFVYETVSILKKRLGISIEISNNILFCTHLIISSNSKASCKKSHTYILGILFGKSIVSFNWYLELFNIHNTVSIETFTLLKSVEIDAGSSDSSEMACVYGMSKGFFSNVNITGEISELENALIKLLNGTTTTNETSKRLTIKINTYEELYYLIILDSSNKWYLDMFPHRNCVYRIR